MDRIINILLLITGVCGTISSTIAAYYTAATYYGWSPSTTTGGTGGTPMKFSWIISLFVLGILLLTTTWIVGYKVWTKNASQTVKEAKFIKWPDPYKPISVIGKTFQNERVPLDGYSYSRCTFYNVSFVYNGTTTLQFTNCTVKGFTVRSDNPAVEGAMLLMAGFYGIKGDVRFVLPPGNHFEPQ